MTNQRLVRGLIDLGHEILLVKPSRDDAPVPEKGSLSILEVFGVPIPNYAGLKLGLPAPGQLEQQFEAYCPDLVHVATEGPLGLSALHAARKLGLPVSSTFHTNFQDYCADYGAAFAGRAMMRYLRWFHNKCVLTTVPDQELIRRLGREGVERLEMLGRGADIELFTPQRRNPDLRARWGADADTPVALYVGRAAAEKNIPFVLETWKQASKRFLNLKMVVVGDGPVLKKLQRKWPEVHFAGMRYDVDLATYYASADLFLFASESETFGNVVVEAMASGLVTLTYDYAAGRQFIRSGENGFLAPFGDKAAFTKCVDEILTERENWEQIRQAARKTAENYPWTATIQKFSSLLSEAAKSKETQPQIDIVMAMSEL